MGVVVVFSVDTVVEFIICVADVVANGDTMVDECVIISVFTSTNVFIDVVVSIVLISPTDVFFASNDVGVNAYNVVDGSIVVAVAVDIAVGFIIIVTSVDTIDAASPKQK